MEDNLFDKIREMTGKFPERFNILEEQIDVKIQMEYFKFSRKLKKEKNSTPIDIDTINDIDFSTLSSTEQKTYLVKIAGIDDPKAFRFLEDFVKMASPDIKDWAILALQESKMLLESTLLNENQIFISTGLGGKGNMLRYFIVLIGEGIEEFAEFQQKIISSEFEFALKNNHCELEKIEFQENYTTILALIPFDIPFQKIFRTTLEECNQFGSFLKPNFLVTNVKPLTLTEIKDFVEKNELPDKDEYDRLDFDQIDEQDDDEE